MADVLILGAGAIGCASALALARDGRSVLVLEKGAPGGGASSAAAGILGAQLEPHGDGPLVRLCLASRARFAAWAARLEEETAIDTGYRRSGGTRVAFGEAELAALAVAFAWQTQAGLAVERLGREALRALEPALSGEVAGGLHFPDDALVDPRSLVKALHVAAQRAGARFRTGALVRRVLVEGGRARGVLLEDGSRVEGDRVLVAAGSWSSLVEGTGLPPDAVRPARGQMVELQAASPPVRGAVFGPGCYLSPRPDGRVLVGSTVELVGYRPGVTASAVRDLLAAATRLVPALDDAAVTALWSGFRPLTRDELPLLGTLEAEGLLVATGHFRNGILLAPLTAEIVAALVAGATLPADLAPFAPARLGRAG